MKSNRVTDEARRGCCPLRKFLRAWIPAHRATLAIAVYGHAARDGDAIAEFERAVGCGAVSYTVEEVLHVGDVHVRRSSVLPGSGDSLRIGHLLRNIRDYSGARDSTIGAEHVFGCPQLVIAETGS